MNNKNILSENEQRLMVNDKENQIIMFSCNINIEFLADLDTLYIDWNYEYCLKFFLQTSSFHELKEDHYIHFFLFAK